ncbi:MAG: PEP-utilizing enzyme [Patescibacteria group bacterium]|nr:PEP-utilizing enzyme [Patescibacteria group bacterium]
MSSDSTITEDTNNIVAFLKKRKPLERIVEFPKIPVLYFEAMGAGYEKNVYAEKLGIKYAPVGVIFLEKNYEGWLDLTSKVIVTDPVLISQISKDADEYQAKSREYLSGVCKSSDDTFSVSELRNAINKINEISSAMYYRYIFFTDELFNISDEKIIINLQETRLRLDDFVTNYLFKAYDKVFHLLIDKFSFPREIIERATTSEIFELLEKNEIDEFRYLVERPIAFIFIEGQKTVLFGNDAMEVINFLRSQGAEEPNTVKAKRESIIEGKVGNKGQAIGRVIILRAEDYYNKEKIKSLNREKQYILVTPMTTPKLVPYVKNALGFVTDEGGITCHAAIVSRELGIPCIIGTKIATKVLKDGDLVEVDADNGVVKILNK